MYINDNYRKVKDELERRRSAARATAEERNLMLRERYEDICAIDAELTKTGLRLFRAAAMGESIDTIRERNRALNEQRRALLVQYGYPEDFTEVHYTCPLCSDTGYQGIRMCSCFREELIRENIRSSGIGNLMERQSFESFDLDWYKRRGPEAYKKMKYVFEQAKTFAEGFHTGAENLLFMGPTGSGKTHLSTAIASVVVSRGFGVVYDTAQNVISAFETDHFRRTEGDGHTADKYLECDLLILDDLGTEFLNSFSLSCLYNLFNTRQNRGLSTILSTNLSFKALAERYEDRIYSRLVGDTFRVLPFDGDDHRLAGL